MQKRINSILLPKDSDRDNPCEDIIRKSSLFTEALSKLGTSERRVKELEFTNEKITEKWAEVKGELDLAKKTLEDLEEKHERRWTELVSQFSESSPTQASVSTALREESSCTSSNGNSADKFTTAKRTAELESKLQQALEAVSRMDTLRTTLADAYKMNEQLQSKLEDLRAKNAKMVAEKVSAREKIKEVETSTVTESLTSPPVSSKKSIAGSSSSSGDPIIEKLQQNYRRARKEFSAAVLSKDQAKLKQEVRCFHLIIASYIPFLPHTNYTFILSLYFQRAEKERDALMKTNARLLKQSSDKDDMNAKSLSTILHLKQRNEELEKENDIAKQRAQAAQQLSLAARLASNAKDRVGEEALKEKEVWFTFPLCDHSKPRFH